MPMPKGAKIKNDDEDLDLSDLESAIDAAMEKGGNFNSIAEAAVEHMTDTSMPSDTDEDEDEEEEVEAGGDAASPEGEAAEPEAEAEEAAEPEAPEAPEPITLGPAARRLAALGWTNVDAMTEDQAVDILANEAVQSRKALADSAPLMDLGRRAFDNIDKIGPMLGGAPNQQLPGQPMLVDNAAVRTQTPNAMAQHIERLKALKEKLSAPAPEYDPSWEHSGVVYQGGMFHAPGNMPGLAAIADTLNTYANWQKSQVKSLPSELADTIQTMSDALTAAQTGGITPEMVRGMVQETRVQEATNEFLQKEVLGKNASWMFHTTADGKGFLRDPQGNMILTPEGQRYDKYVTLLHEKGMRNIVDLHTFALAYMSAGAPSSGVDHSQKAGKKTASQVGTAASQTGQSDAEKAAALKARGKEKAVGTTGKTGISKGAKLGGDSKPAPTLKRSDKRTLEDEFREELAKAGITDGSIRFGAEEDDE